MNNETISNQKMLASATAPDAELYPLGGHMMFREHADRFNRVLSRFLDANLRGWHSNRTWAVANASVERVPDVQAVILVCMSKAIRHAAAVVAVMTFVTAGCGGNGNADKAEPGAGLEDQRATVVSEFERAVEQARYLRDDIAAVRADMKAVREAANYEAERASKEAAGLRDEIAALRREMKELSEAAASEVERTAEEAKSLREEVAAIRVDMSAAREAAQEAESLSPDEIDGNLTEAEKYPQAVVVDGEVTYLPYSSRRRAQVIYGPSIAQRPFAAQRRTFRRDGQRQSHSGNAKPHASQVANTKPAATSSPNVSNTRPQAPSARPAAPSARPAAPSARPAMPSARPASRPANTQPRRIRVPTPRR